MVNAYMSESAAYSRYMFYATQAEKENYFPVQRAFEETAANELRHAKVYFKMLEGGSLPCSIDVDAGVIGDTASNLETAIREERIEGTEMYLKAADVADAEGFPEVALHFRSIAEIEECHRLRFIHLLERVKNGTLWKRDKPVRWKCLVCGYEYVGTEPPAECPACDHPYQHYIALDDELEPR